MKLAKWCTLLLKKKINIPINIFHNHERTKQNLKTSTKNL